MVEDRAGPVLKGLTAGDALSAQAKDVLGQFFGVQMLRGPTFFQDRSELLDEALTEELVDRHASSHLKAITRGDKQLARRQVVEMFDDPTQRFVSMLALAQKAGAAFCSMQWQLLRFAKPVVAYCDQPVVVWPMDLELRQATPSAPTYVPLSALEVRVPLSPHLILLMTWADRPDVVRPVRAAPYYAAETNALVVAQADRQWMHHPETEPPISQSVLRPISPEFVPGYSVEAAQTSRRRRAVWNYLMATRGQFHRTIEVFNVAEDLRGLMA